MIKYQNIYHMLAYAFQTLRQAEYKHLGQEKFEDALDLNAAILCTGVNTLIKRGLSRGYIDKSEKLGLVKGKIEVSESLKQNTLIDKKLVCTYDLFSENIKFNQILKSTFLNLLHKSISNERKKSIKIILQYFSKVSIIDLHNVSWHFTFDRSNNIYKTLMYFCRLVSQNALITENSPSNMLDKYLDGMDLPQLYEKFVLEYYRKHTVGLNPKASIVNWCFDNADDCSFLPSMKTDITLTSDDVVLIIDTKYYKNILTTYREKKSVRSGHLYQVFSYVTNAKSVEYNRNKKVYGMLLYAKTDDTSIPNDEYRFDGTSIKVTSIDLNTDFCNIEDQLKDIIKSYFGPEFLRKDYGKAK